MLHRIVKLCLRVVPGVTFLGLSLLHAADTGAWVPQPRTWLVFASADCEECEWLKLEFLPALETRFGTQVPPVAFIDIDDMENYALLSEAETLLGAQSGEEFPAFLVGSTFVYGKAAIAAWGESMGATIPRPALSAGIIAIASRARDVSFYADEFAVGGESSVPAAGSVPGTPAETSVAAAAAGGEVDAYTDARIIYFETTGCKKCARAEKQLAFALSRLRSCTVYRTNTLEPDGRALQYAITGRLELPNGKRLITPMFVSGERALYGKEITDAGLQKLLQEAGADPFWHAWDEAKELAAARRRLQDMASGFTLIKVIGAGLIDGFNPCAFAVIVFLVSYLTLTGKLGRKFALMYGLIFAAGVFTCYFLIGLGFFQLLEFLETWKSAMRWIFAAMGVVCIGFGIAGVVDTVGAYRGGASKMKFGMPKSLHRLVHRLIREDVSRGALGIGAFLIGIAVSGVELVCTGQIYLPVIMYINTRAPGLKSVGLLTLYNLAFIIPLIVVVVLGSAGMGSQALAGWARKHAALTRALTTALVFALAVIMLIEAFRV